MADKPITEQVTETREVTGVIADLIKFARMLGTRRVHPDQLADDEYMVPAAREYWDREHGED